MEYQGPEPADLANVEALNHAFLRWVRERRNDARPADEFPPELADRLVGMRDRDIDRLARTPFLLMTLDEQDERRWGEVFACAPGMDLFETHAPPGDAENRLIMAVLGFLWQLARRNPYTARLVSGASLDWCDQLVTLPLVVLFAQAGRCAPLRPRLARNDAFWRKLLGAGVSARKDVRLAARISAMQTVITKSIERPRPSLATAACSMRSVAARVADRHRG